MCFFKNSSSPQGVQLALVWGIPVPVPLASLLDQERERNGDLETGRLSGSKASLPETHASANKHQGFRRAVSVVAGSTGLPWPPDPCLSKQLANPGAGRLTGKSLGFGVRLGFEFYLCLFVAG